MFVEQDALRLRCIDERLGVLPGAGKLHHMEGQGGGLHFIPILDHDVDALDHLSLTVLRSLDPEGNARKPLSFESRLDLESRFTFEGKKAKRMRRADAVAKAP